MSQFIFNLPVPPLIPADVNIDNNTTRIMETNTTYGLTITDGQSVLTGGTISNLNNPINLSDIATKYFADTHIGPGPAGSNTDIQINNGAGGFMANNKLVFDGTTMRVNTTGGTITDGTITLSGGRLSNVSNPYSGQQGATKDYIDMFANVLTQTTVNSDYGVDYSYTPAQVVNTVLNRTFNRATFSDTFVNTDFLPSAADVIAYINTYSQVTIGTSFKTIIRIGGGNVAILRLRFISESFDESYKVFPENNIIDGIVDNLIIVTGGSINTITSVITDITPGSEKIIGFLTQNTFNSSQGNLGVVVEPPLGPASITDQGLLTASFNLVLDPSNDTRNGMIIFPLVPQIISDLNPQTYTYANLQAQLIIRADLILATTDTFVTAAVIAAEDVFLMGGGTFRFFVQNSSAFNLTLAPSAGWSFLTGNPNVIPSMYVGAYLVSVTISPPTCVVRTLNLASLNG